jgi:hypothetical protein
MRGALLGAAIGLALIYALAVRPPWAERLYAHAVALWDPKPEVSFWELVHHPERIPEHWRDLCDWLGREVHRNDNPLLPAMRDHACERARATSADPAPVAPPH